MPKGLGHGTNTDIGVNWVNASVSQIYVKRIGTGLTLSHVINADIGVNQANTNIIQIFAKRFGAWNKYWYWCKLSVASISQIYVKRVGIGLTISHVKNANIGVN